MRKSWLQLVLVSAVFTLFSETAWATPINVPQGVTYVGTFGGFAATITQPPGPNAACPVRNIAWEKLNGNYEIVGSSNNDTIVVLAAAASICGVTMTPIIQNGYALGIGGMNGNDMLVGQGLHNVYAVGGSGDDLIFDYGGNWTDGGANNDFIQAGNQAAMEGGSGNDTFCVISGQVPWLVRGHDGYDRLCNIDPGQVYYEGIEETGCSCGGF